MILAFISNPIRVAVTAVLLTAQIVPASDLHTGNGAVELLIQKARSLEARDREDLAAQVWQQVLVSNPNQPEALAALARWAKQSGRNEDANTYLARLRRLAPDSPVLTELDSVDSANKAGSRLNEAAKLAASQHFDEAMRVYRDVFGSNPPAGGWAIAYYETLANTSGGMEPAMAALKQLADTYPNVPDYKISAGRLMTYRPATRQAGVKLLASIEGSNSAAAKARLAWRQALVWEKTNLAFGPAIKDYLARYNDPELQAALLSQQSAKADAAAFGSKQEQLGYQALKTGNLPQAENQFGEVLNKDAKSWRAHAGLGFVDMKAGDFDAAVEQLEAAHKLAPGDATVSKSLESAKFWQAMHVGTKAAEEQNWANAIASYRIAIGIRPNDHDALRALGGSLVAAGSPREAIPYLAKATRAQASDETSWCALLQATLQAQGGRSALAIAQSVPPSISAILNRNFQWRALQASAHLDAGEEPPALKIYRELVTSGPANLKVDEEIQLASLALRFHQASQAIPYAEKAVDSAPEKPGAWDVLISALISSGKQQEAERTYARMPLTVQQILTTRPGFQQSLASLKEASGDLESARTLLDAVVNRSENGMTDQDRTAAKIHLAEVLGKLGRPEEAETMLNTVLDTNPDNVDAWRAQLLILQSAHRPGEIVSAAASMPQAVAVRLQNQGDITNLLAAAHAATGDAESGVKMLETYIARKETSDPKNTVTQRIQLGWLLVDAPRKSAQLYALLDQLNGRTDLSPDQRSEVSNLWVTWISRSSEAARKEGNPQRSLAILEQGIKMFPGNPDLQRGLAGGLLSQGDTKRAFNVYSNWGLSGGKPEDYAGAISAAMTLHNDVYADTWIRQGLSQWPGDPKLLSLAGDRAQSHHDLKKAEALWKEALAQKDAQPGIARTAVEDPRQPSLETLLVGSNPPASPLKPTTDSNTSAKVHLANYQPANEAVASLLADPASSYLPKRVLESAPQADPLQDKIAAVDSRNTPYLSSRTLVWGRGGDPGFSRLLIQQAQFEASTTLADSLRASLLLEPTYLSGGTATGSGDLLFGRQISPAGFGPQTAGGLAAEAQLSGQSFGIDLGTSPRGFLISSWTGGLRIQPKDGPISFMLERDDVKDSMLSYAGGRDPLSNQIWGGVMANSGTLQGHWGDNKSGFYASVGFQMLDGRNVEKNTAANGNAGVWWKVATFPTGDLTLGMNFSAMAYEHNLRYFTFGQGGYFSPQQYFLLNAPVRWTGNYGKRLRYTIGGSLGSQHFSEDASAYYPTDPVLQARQQMYYQPLSSTGANFSFDGRLSYQLAPHWMLGAFAMANNARNYTAASAGLFVNYTFEERPLDLQTVIPSVPDWRGQQPFLPF